MSEAGVLAHSVRATPERSRTATFFAICDAPYFPGLVGLINSMPLQQLRLTALTAALLLGSAGMRAAELHAELRVESVTVTVAAQPGQSFMGFGASLIPDKNYARMSVDRRSALARLIWHDLGFKVLRLWANTTRATTAPDEYIDSGMISDALANGATTLLLAPEGEGAEHPVSYAQAVAQIIDEYRKRGISVQFTGVANEPGSGAAGSIKSPQQMVELVKSLRSALDGANLASVKIIAPELPSADGKALEWFDALRSSEAWRSLHGFSTHSYNMAATDEMARRLRDTGKEYWITEASDNGPEAEDNAEIAASVAARVLNDWNHMANVWIFFIGYLTADPNDNATRIIAYDDGRSGEDWLTIFLKYYYLRQLSHAFDVGARFRPAASSREGSMVWTYGRKPRVTAAAAQNPDGSWAIALVNYTSDDFTKVNTWKSTQSGEPAQAFDVTIDVRELHRSGACVFDAHRSNTHRHDASEGTITARDGLVTVKLNPLDLLTLRSRPPNSCTPQ